VRRCDGSQAPFEPDRICQSLYTAAESLGDASAFVIRELTDVVLHFIAQESWDGIPTTRQLAEHVEKIVREIGHPELARRYAEQRRQTSEPSRKRITVACLESPNEFVTDCLQAYALESMFSRDVAAAIRDGLLQVSNLHGPAALASLVLETPHLADIPWWPALDAWRAMGGSHWIVDSPEWLAASRPHPALTAHLCEHLLALPTLAERDVELHLNIAEPPAWSRAHAARPLFTTDDDVSQQERSSFLDNLLERWKALDTDRIPAIAWHLAEPSFADETQRRQLHGLLRQALQGKPIRFVFDRPHTPLVLAEGLDRKCPAVLLEVGLDLPTLARQTDVGVDGAAFLKKLPSLVRIGVSAAQQKQRFLRALPDAAFVKQGFLLDRASVIVAPIGLHDMVQAITGASPAQSPLSLDFAMQIIHEIRAAMHVAARSTHLDLRLDSAMSMPVDAFAFPPRRHLEIAGKLHARAGAGTAALQPPDDSATDVESLIQLLQWACASTAVVRLQLQRAAPSLQQGELPIRFV
jgi:hypothetical protein